MPILVSFKPSPILILSNGVDSTGSGVPGIPFNSQKSSLDILGPVIVDIHTPTPASLSREIPFPITKYSKGLEFSKFTSVSQLSLAILGEYTVY